VSECRNYLQPALEPPTDELGVDGLLAPSHEDVILAGDHPPAHEPVCGRGDGRLDRVECGRSNDRDEGARQRGMTPLIASRTAWPAPCDAPPKTTGDSPTGWRRRASSSAILISLGEAVVVPARGAAGVVQRRLRYGHPCRRGAPVGDGLLGGLPMHV
jgi:hypothetical protein